MKKAILTISLLLSIIALFQSQTVLGADNPLIYKSATEYDYPPFSVTDSGEADGFSVELLKEVLNVMGLEATFKIDEWNVLKEELANGQLDILPLVGYTEERDEVYDFTIPYIIMHGNIFVRKGNDSIKSEADLNGKEIIVMEGDNAHEYAMRMGFTDNLILTKTYTEAFRLLESGKHDAVLAQGLVGQELLNSLDIRNIEAATEVLDDDITELKINLTGFEQKFCFAVKEGNKDLLAKLNEGLAIVSANGKFNELYNKWFPFLVDRKPTLIETLKSSMVIVVPLIILILFISVIYTERQVKIKTRQLEESNKSILLMEAQLRNQQKLESIGVLASGVAHEINNPLNGIMNYSQIITDLIHERKENCEDTKAEIDSYAEEIITETKRISTIVKDLLQFSRVEKQQMAKTNIRDIIRNMESLINIIVKRDQIDFTMDISDDLPDISCRSHQIQQVILNLLTNSKDALNIKYPGYDEDKKIILTAGPVQKDGRPYIRITVEDRGNGVPGKIKDKIFDPFFTTKSRAEGTGLGLSISYGIIKDHGGELSFESEEGKYTRFFIDLPIGEKS